MDRFKSSKMARAIVLYSAIAMSVSISLAIIVALFISHNRDDDNSTKQFDDLKADFLRKFAGEREYLQALVALDKNNTATDIQSNLSMDQSLHNVVDTIKNLSRKVEVTRTAVKDVGSKVEALNSSLQMVEYKVERMETELRSLQKTCNSVATLNSSLQLTQSLTSTTAWDSDTSKTIVEGVIVVGADGISTVALPSLQQTKIANGWTNEVAFDWNSRKVYWMENGVDGIQKGNLDGTDVELVITDLGRPNWLLAVDSITGNIYHKTAYVPHQDIRVCSSNGEKCSTVVANQHIIHGFALYPSKSLMFWTNITSLLRANMDGTNARVLFSEYIPNFAVDETSERLCWISGRKDIVSCDLNGKDCRVLWRNTGSINNMAISGDSAYFSNRQGILSGRKAEGNLSLITNMARVKDIALYGSKGNLRENPCQGSPCSHLCIPQRESFACLCPQGEHLSEDGVTCV